MTAGEQRSGANYQVRALERGIDLLNAFSLITPALSITQLAARVGLPKSTVVRLVAILTERGLLERLPDHEAYRIGIRAFEIGSIYIQSTSLEAEARPIMARLAETTRQTANLGILDQGDIVHIAIEAPDRPVRYWATIGKREDPHYTGLGKVLLAALDAATLTQFLADHELSRRTPRTIVDPAALQAELQQVRAQGYALDDEESNLGLRCLAAPITGKDGHVLAAVSISGSLAEFADDALPGYTAAVIAAARDISHRLGSGVHAARSRDGDAVSAHPAGNGDGEIG